MMVNSVLSATQLQTLQFDLKLHQKLSMPKPHSSIASLVRFVQHKHQLLCEIALQFSAAPSCYLFNWVYYTPHFSKNTRVYPDFPPSCSCRSWCLQQSMLMAMCWQCQTICLCTTTPSTGGELEDSIPRKVRLLIWNMVGKSFSLVGIAALNVPLFGLCLCLLVSKWSRKGSYLWGQTFERDWPPEQRGNFSSVSALNVVKWQTSKQTWVQRLSWVSVKCGYFILCWLHLFSTQNWSLIFFSRLPLFLTGHLKDVAYFLKCSTPKFWIAFLLSIGCWALWEIHLFFELP